MKNLSVIAILFLLTACVFGSKPSNFYQIQSIKPASAVALSNTNISIGIDRMQIPPYIDKPQIVTIIPDTLELNISEFNRWVGPLSSGLPRVIANDMAFYLPNAFIKPKTSINEVFDYTLVVEINRLDATFDKTAELDAWWTIYKGSKAVVRKESFFELPVGASYGDIVEKQSILVEKLSKEISQSFVNLK